MKYLILLLVFSINAYAKEVNLICEGGSLQYQTWDSSTDKWNQTLPIVISFNEETNMVAWQGKDLMLWLCDDHEKTERVDIKEHAVVYKCSSGSDPNPQIVIDSTSASWVLNRYTGVLTWNSFKINKKNNSTFIVDGKSTCNLNEKRF